MFVARKWRILKDKKYLLQCSLAEVAGVSEEIITSPVIRVEMSASKIRLRK